MIFPDKSPSTIDDDNQSYNNEPSTIFNKRYCLFESTLNLFFTSRHLFRLIHCNKLLFMEMLPSNLHELIGCIKSNNLDKITEKSIATLMSITLSCIGFAGFSMPINLESDIIQFLKNSDVSQENEDHCRFYFLNAMFKTGRLLFYRVDDTQEGWRRAIFTSMALLSDRISTIEIIQKSMQVDLNDVPKSNKHGRLRSYTEKYDHIRRKKTIVYNSCTRSPYTISVLLRILPYMVVFLRIRHGDIRS
ncbi:unnamed protein product [Rotaria magnacalcarata]|uniref:Uncharacterized protein n=2 Tax=Rotaria magnacalcarata TaxID=392030 RepID=A0A8S2WUE8_9BILA|nr:unnamed protein product [Rotaria magnacalcarata]CAF4463589.1 unnamed protein product [Rotaria magnacalcarata]